MEPPAANGRELDVLWPAILDSLAPNQRVWLASSKPVMLAESTAVIAVPNEFTRSQLEGRLRTRLEDALSDSLNRPIRIAVTVDDTLAPPEPGQDVPGDTVADADAGAPVGSPDLKAGVAYYGAQPKAEEVPKIKAALLLHYAGLDERINAGIDAYRKALNDNGKDATIYVYDGVNHAFNNDTSAARYDKVAADLAWGRTVEFLKAKLA